MCCGHDLCSKDKMYAYARIPIVLFESRNFSITYCRLQSLKRENEVRESSPLGTNTVFGK